MEPTAQTPQSPAGGAGYRLSFLPLGTMIFCLCVTAFGAPTAVLCASTPPQIPLFTEAPSTVPPAIAQALPAPQTLKR